MSDIPNEVPQPDPVITPETGIAPLTPEQHESLLAASNSVLPVDTGTAPPQIVASDPVLDTPVAGAEQGSKTSPNPHLDLLQKVEVFLEGVEASFARGVHTTRDEIAAMKKIITSHLDLHL